MVRKEDSYILGLRGHFKPIFAKKGKGWGVECFYIPNGADIIPVEQAKGEIKLQGQFNIVYTGDKAKWKRTEDACKSMQNLPKEIKLYFTGHPASYLDKYSSENCIFLGYLTKEEQYNVMRQADAFIVTADQDCNAKLQEYLRWHKPILAFDGRANLFLQMVAMLSLRRMGIMRR